ncbi:DUF4258 domain-containing protein [Robertkochia solimangrovi]|uniref:DUF4258 domain-containing protein n=1 Tax=Robertkochia solimangrovi TaxID=2213046 RepID=UPI00117EAAD7|nr:DUF4258 domain-containing protein [Robertkochia solimangrovi]TRZ45219.1 DUF4258 domain-containing protein [Robertkochia solimangrovi]
MPFLKKLGFFLIGLSIGLVIVAYFMKEKKVEFCYFPNCRVLKDLREKQMTFSPEVRQLIDNKIILKEQIDTVLLDGTVDFSKSNTETDPCKSYYISGYMAEKEVALTVDRCDSIAEIKKIMILE